ncbi:MAG TPA: acetyltransferase [Flavipsychrobacter sp.]|nr:acetyltransferase [Flavipsychrobacter sp.]
MYTGPIVVYGAGGLGREVFQLLEKIDSIEKCWTLCGFIDDNLPKQTRCGYYSVLENGAFLNSLPEPNRVTDSNNVVIAIGDPTIKKQVADSLTNPFLTYPVIIHPSVEIEKELRANIGEGSIITAGNLLTVDIKIGRHVLLNLGCTVGHDVQIGDYCSVMPGVNISGNVTLEEGVFVGTGAKILNNVTIGARTKIGAGAVVTQSLPPDCTAVGVPARIVKQ